MSTAAEAVVQLRVVVDDWRAHGSGSDYPGVAPYVEVVLDAFAAAEVARDALWGALEHRALVVKTDDYGQFWLCLLCRGTTKRASAWVAQPPPKETIAHAPGCLLATQAPAIAEIKCLVASCPNRSTEGPFVGPVCFPCAEVLQGRGQAAARTRVVQAAGVIGGDVRYRTKDHPAANGRTPLPGEHVWTVYFPLEDGRTLYVEGGAKARETFADLIPESALDDVREAAARNKELVELRQQAAKDAVGLRELAKDVRASSDGRLRGRYEWLYALAGRLEQGGRA